MTTPSNPSDPSNGNWQSDGQPATGGAGPWGAPNGPTVRRGAPSAIPAQVGMYSTPLTPTNRRRKRPMIIGVVVALPFLVVACLLFWSAHSSNQQRQNDPALQASDVQKTDHVPWAVQGDIRMPGDAITPSDDWINGIGSAWTIEEPAWSSGSFSYRVAYATNGALVITSQNANTWQSTLKGWDISGDQPRQLWSHTVQDNDKPDLDAEEKGVWVGNTLFIDEYAINGDTGDIASISWLRSEKSSRTNGNDLVVTPDLVLVACDPGTGECSAHTADGTQLWTASTGLSSYTLRGTAQTGGHTWIRLDAGTGRSAFVNTATGETKSATYGSGDSCWHAAASDGWLIACQGDAEITAFTADGESAGTFAATYWPLSTRGKSECSDATTPVWAQTPTLAQATAFYRDGDISGTRGALTPTDCGNIVYQAPDGTTTDLDLTRDINQRAFTLGDLGGVLQKQLAISDSGKVLVIGNAVFVDLTSGAYMGSVSDDHLDWPLLSAPGLVLLKDDTGIVAYKPR